MQTLHPYSVDTLESNNEILRLNNNENLLFPALLMQNILRKAATLADPRFYSTIYFQQLLDALSKYLDIEPDAIVIGAGGDALIDLVAGPMMSPCDSALLIEPTFSMYRSCLSIHNRTIQTVFLKDDFSIDVEKIRESLKGTDEVVFICSPNNPSGNQFEREDIQSIIESTEGLVVLDEAYVDFAPESLVSLTKEYENLFVMRTFSKAFGLAGMRLGYAVTDRTLADMLRRYIILPYPVSTMAVTVALLLLENINEVQRVVTLVKSVREKLSSELDKLNGVQVYPSVTNFVLLKVQQSSAILAQRLLDLSIKVRVVDWPQNRFNFLRIAIPPVEELERVLSCFKEVLDE
jgi:histidinol-phosphate aminotransferase